MVDVIIVGAGLAGLAAADMLNRAGRTVTVVEARPFVGGRTMTMTVPELGPRGWFDMGATWHWEDQPLVRALAADVGMETFRQFRDGQAVAEATPGAPPTTVNLPPPSPAELRFVGGAQSLCERLADRLTAAGGKVLLDTSAVAVERNGAAGDGSGDGSGVGSGEGSGDGSGVGSGDGSGVTVSVVGPDDVGAELEAGHVIVAVPPRLVLENIAFTPDLPPDLEDVMRLTPTWMATALKCVAVYESPFWREAGLSGLAFSDAGPLREVHDACADDASVAALWGFVSPRHEFRDLTFDARIEQVFAQLGRLFGAPPPIRSATSNGTGRETRSPTTRSRGRDGRCSSSAIPPSPHRSTGAGSCGPGRRPPPARAAATWKAPSPPASAPPATCSGDHAGRRSAGVPSVPRAAARDGRRCVRRRRRPAESARGLDGRPRPHPSGPQRREPRPDAGGGGPRRGRRPVRRGQRPAGGGHRSRLAANGG